MNIYSFANFLNIIMAQCLKFTGHLWGGIAIQYQTIQCNAMQCNAMQCNAMQCNAMQCNAMQCNAIQYALLSWKGNSFAAFVEKYMSKRLKNTQKLLNSM